MYYYLDNCVKQGPYSIIELRALNLPINTLIWSYGWDDYKPISDCPEVMEYFTLNPPEIPVNTTEQKDVQDANLFAVYPSIHWIPKVLMIFGIVGCLKEIIFSFFLISLEASFVWYAAAIVAEIIAIGGMLAKKKWALISYFILRSLALVILIMYSNMGLVGGEDVVKEFIKFLLTACVFLIPKDGHNVYELLWNNGVFYVPIENPIVKPVEQPEDTNTEVTE